MLRADGACAIFRWNDKMGNAQFFIVVFVSFFGVARFSFLVASCNCVSCISNHRAEKISLYMVWRSLFLLLLTSSASNCLQLSRNRVQRNFLSVICIISHLSGIMENFILCELRGCYHFPYLTRKSGLLCSW